jgi:tetratricopeptide (TPR) repeat protein
MAANHKQNVKKAKKQKKRRENIKKQSLAQQESTKKSVDDQVDTALSVLNEGHLKAGESMLNTLRRKYPRHPMVSFGLGVLAMRNEDYPDAVARFEDTIDLAPDVIEAHFNLAAAYQATGNLPGMIIAYRYVFEHGGPESMAVVKAAESLGRIERMLRDTQGVGLTEFLEGHDHFHRGLDLMAAKQWDMAADAFTAALAVLPRSPQAYGNLGICHAVRGKREDALDAFDRAIAINPDYEPALVHRARLMAVTDDDNLAGEVRIIDFDSEYTRQGKSYIREVLDSLEKKSSPPPETDA